MSVLNINILAVVVAAIAHQAIGYLWYGALFGKMWMKARGVTTMGDPMRPMIIASISALVMALGMAMVISAAPVQNLVAGLTLGAVAGVFFVGASSVINGAYEQRSWTVTILFVCYEVVSLVAMGAIIGFWR
ncbi:MAG: DUF1761 domain-containing protein [Chloroflexota bacterium]|nr:MAG: DUF1761 domain-containing protein [Chloroflexota bacterium]